MVLHGVQTNVERIHARLLQGWELALEGDACAPTVISVEIVVCFVAVPA